ncbi:MAG TPA: GNAT family N-acetyltransferase [Sphingomonas sp.]|nr:GNAT family N-acetyltransferase [Sphingomonas sp.]
MTKPMLLAEFTRLPPASRACPLDGLSAAIDMVAQAAPASHRFLRYQYYAAALALHGGAARTMLVEHDGNAVIALPFVRTGPAAARLAMVPGIDAPFRGFPAATDTPEAAFDTLVDALAGELSALRIGPVAEGDATFAALRAAATRRGWIALDRPVPDSPLTGSAGSAGGRAHQLDGAALIAGGFDTLAIVDAGAAFTFWRAAAEDSVLAAMMSAVVTVQDDKPIAFTLHLDSGGARHLVARGRDAAAATDPPPATRDWLLVRPGLPALLGRVLRGLWLRRPVDQAPPASL